jgi:hypothetical protein
MVIGKIIPVLNSVYCDVEICRELRCRFRHCESYHIVELSFTPEPLYGSEKGGQYLLGRKPGGMQISLKSRG